MSTKETGGPAFPVMDETPAHGQHYGLTMRDWFAGMALAGKPPESVLNPEQWAKIAYEIADAMLKARDA